MGRKTLNPEALTFCKGYLCRAATKAKHVLCVGCWQKVAPKRREFFSAAVKWKREHHEDEHAEEAVQCAARDAIRDVREWSIEHHLGTDRGASQ